MKILPQMVPQLYVPPFIRKYHKLLFHAFLITIIFTFWITFVWRSIDSWGSFLQIFFYSMVYVVAVYFNSFFLFDKLLLRGKFAGYIIATLLSVLVGCFILAAIYARSLQQYVQDAGTGAFYVEFILEGIKFITFTGLGLMYRLLNLWINGERKLAALTNENLKAELTMLKTQVSPHFLFNTLNNLYVLTKTRPALAADTVLNLADLIRYQLNECDQDRVPLSREIDHIRNLLKLEQLRKDKWLIELDLPGNVPATQHIEPMLFITLVENAVKHGTQQLETGILRVKLELSGDKLLFYVKNTIASFEYQSGEGHRIGISNLQRRLELLYPGRHSLTLEKTGNEFNAILKLDL